MEFSRFMEGQFPKSCDLCETGTVIKWKCINCNVLMCSKCKEKVHSKIRYSDKHKILDIKEAVQHSEELDFSNISCQDHEREVCVMFCKSCDQLVCTLCVTKVHNGHGLVQISEGYNIRIGNVKEGQKQMEIHLVKMANGESKIKLLRDSENSKYQETRSAIEAQGEALKKAVDKYTEKLITELDKKWETLQNALDQEERRLTTIKMRIENFSTIAGNLVNSKDAVEIFSQSKKIGKPVIESVEPIKLKFATMPKFLPGEITEHTVGLFQDMPDLVMKVVKQFTTDITDVFYHSTCPDNSLWISDQKVLQKVKPEGRTLKVMSNFKINMWGMAVTPSNDLLLVTEDQSRLKQIRGSGGRVTDSVYSVDPLVITAVHVTSDYKVIVGAGGSVRRVVIRMNKEGKHKKTYENDRNKQPIFTYVYSITTTTNGTLFVVNWSSYKDARGRVVIMGQDVNTYTGHPKINSDDKPFKPQCVVTTHIDNIIVADRDTHTLHILNSVGHLITYYNTENIAIQRPFSLSLIHSGQMYIGCTRAVGSSDKAKLYKVDISQM